MFVSIWCLCSSVHFLLWVGFLLLGWSAERSEARLTNQLD
jgi:hypothetical protein